MSCAKTTTQNIQLFNTDGVEIRTVEVPIPHLAYSGMLKAFMDDHDDEDTTPIALKPNQNIDPAALDACVSYLDQLHSSLKEIEDNRRRNPKIASPTYADVVPAVSDAFVNTIPPYLRPQVFVLANYLDIRGLLESCARSYADIVITIRDSPSEQTVKNAIIRDLLK